MAAVPTLHMYVPFIQLHNVIKTCTDTARMQVYSTVCPLPLPPFPLNTRTHTKTHAALGRDRSMVLGEGRWQYARYQHGDILKAILKDGDVH